MIVYRGAPETWEEPGGGSAVAVGVFDGIHRGHLRVLEALDGAPEGTTRVAMTFGTHPAALLSPQGAPTRLSTLKRRFDLLQGAGVERIALLSFDEEMRRMEPREFVRRYLVGGLGARFVTVGEDFRFGADAAGDVETLTELGERHGFTVVPVETVTDEGVEIRSTAIRSAVAAGDVKRAGIMLGRPHEVEGIVVPGDGRGRRIGIPTANVSYPATLTVPSHGVYAVIATVDGVGHPAVANLGTRPTFDGETVTLEVHLIDTTRDVYGKEMRVGFVERIRDEERFDGAEKLEERIRADIEAAKGILSEQAP